MDKRQVIILFWIGAILAWISACVPLKGLPATPTQQNRLAATQPPPSPTLVLAEPSPTTSPCRGTRGQVEKITFDSPSLTYFYIYLPECYDLDTEIHYPVLYLLHGQGYEADQWLRLGAAEKAADLMDAGKIPPFLIVFPQNEADWLSVNNDQFGTVFANKLVPFIDENYRTIDERESRALGGISRGAGWAIRYGLTRWGLFGAIGAHSAAIFYNDNGKIDDWIADIPINALPQIYVDVGDQDGERGSVTLFAELLAEESIPHEWRLYSGGHDEIYWRAHVEEYLRWYGCTFGCDLDPDE